MASDAPPGRIISSDLVRILAWMLDLRGGAVYGCTIRSQPRVVGPVLAGDRDALRRSRKARTAASPCRPVTSRRRSPGASCVLAFGNSVSPSRAIDTTNVSTGNAMSRSAWPVNGEPASS